MATVRIDDSLHQKMKEIAKKNKSQSIAKEYENALKQYIENERQNEILIDSQIENLMNKKLDKIDIGIGKYRKSNLNLLFEVNFRLFFS